MSSIPYDFHVHCGVERGGVPQMEFIDGLEARGVELAGLLDHYEFYCGNRGPWFMNFRENAAKKGIELYPDTFEGMQTMYDELFALREKVNLRFAIGIEFRRPDNVEDRYLERPEYITNCFHVNDAADTGSFGERAAGLIRAFGARVRPYGKPAIVNHPFRDCLGPYGDMLEAEEAPPAEQFFPVQDVERMIDAAAEYALALEINLGDTNFHANRHPALADLLVHLYTKLVESGLPLSIGSDAHNPSRLVPSDNAWEVLARAGLEKAHFQQIGEALRMAGGRDRGINARI